ncbi:preprotein translocase subunit SecG [Candidatus Gottesmanbacteria bacterium RIFCSPLOWO2_01_FULL_40_10]|nr:MAG: preprotein translocase subunit SecG [Candidatus Gottesmanbacteria bacterium RIFCSPLOWO2_01_FULL_40_10]OGG25969.1 MAG: preprotein translocase subunit SecG [Candidatus Gottesmanbacteria bacterium RIFCSPHIGHO2_12_FULL_40_13]
MEYNIKVKNIPVIIQSLISVTLIILILIQAKGVGLGRAWGGGGEFYKSRRGVEKIIFNLTVLFAVLFLASSILNIILA